MRSTTRFRLQQCRGVAHGQCAPAGLRKPVFGERSRAVRRLELREGKEALKRLITPKAAHEPELEFLSGELQPLVLADGDRRYEVAP